LDEPLAARLRDILDADLEIGAGQGLHAVAYCKAHPDRTLIAIERTHGRFHALAQRHQNHPDLHNLIVVHADAVSVATRLLRPDSLARIFLLYPNPYPKTKQANQRWHNMPFMGFLLERLKAGGELTLATNIPEYAEEARTRFTEIWGLSLIGDVAPREGRTHFERKYLARGEACRNLTFRKN
jgi:tRNA G46 methylase TrmB